MNLLASYYRTNLLSIHRGIAFGKPSNAKPLLLLAIIKSIEEGTLLGNVINYEEKLETNYYNLCNKFEPDIKAAPFYKPFYHLGREAFYNIKWVNGNIPEHKWHTPSPQIIMKCIEYTYLDNQLWDLLQKEEIREEYKQAIINHFFEQ